MIYVQGHVPQLCLQKIRNNPNSHRYETVVLVSRGCCNKLLQTGWLNTASSMAEVELQDQRNPKHSFSAHVCQFYCRVQRAFIRVGSVHSLPYHGFPPSKDPAQKLLPQEALSPGQRSLLHRLNSHSNVNTSLPEP